MTPKRILLIQLRRVGDVLFTLPAVGALRKQFPQAEIDFLVEEPADQIVRLHAGVHQTLVYKKEDHLRWLARVRRRSYDWTIDFHANGRTLALTLLSGARVRAGFEGPISRRLAYNRRVAASSKQYIVDQKLGLLKSLGVDVGSWSWGFDPPQKEKQWAAQFLESSGWDAKREKLIGFAPASRRETRRWPADRFRQAAERVLENSGDRIVILWGPGEEDLAESIAGAARAGLRSRIVLPPETTLLELAALIQNCSLVLAVDNGPKNLAVALNVPTIALLGPTSPWSFNPHNDPLHPFLRDESLSCIACEQNRCPYRHECMQNLSAEAVFQKIQKVVRLSPSRPAAAAGEKT